LGFVAWRRMTTKAFAKLAVLVLIAAVILVTVATTIVKPYASYNSRFGRLLTVFKPENLRTKDPARSSLFYRAKQMIAARPLGGFGIGTFTKTSLQFAQKDDPFGNFEAFTHNLPLQLASEMGIPFLLVFSAVIVAALRNGYRAAKSGSLEALGVTAAVIVYLVVQLATHVLTTYPSQQFFFWFLIAVLFSMQKRLQPSEIQAS